MFQRSLLNLLVRSVLTRRQKVQKRLEEIKKRNYEPGTVYQFHRQSCMERINREFQYNPDHDLNLGNLKSPQNNKHRYRGKTTNDGRRRTKKTFYRTFCGQHFSVARTTPKITRFYNNFFEEMKTISLADIQLLIDTGRINPNQEITPRSLVENGILRYVNYPGLKLTGEGYEFFQAKVIVKMNWCEPEAVSAIRRAGGEATSVYCSEEGFHNHMKPHLAFKEPVLELPHFKGLWRAYSRADVGGYLHNKWEQIVAEERDRYEYKTDEETKKQAEELWKKKIEGNAPPKDRTPFWPAPPLPKPLFQVDK
eukprot:NODE_5265_length_1039_cov_52.016376_g4702_i0.p1 GENE.NODE_5265_length_1039_cov_52.016376_g4702_i0~~NODE_5265_length_1039_cov_52.016376_g4702_i0.p1  ORF type:complete len:309 (+),score=49.15 NODE_5265_length_1039_cov_52.016376_g4702_i0:54-980(+)